MDSTNTGLMNVLLRWISGILFVFFAFVVIYGQLVAGLPILSDYLAGETVTYAFGEAFELSEAAHRHRMATILLSGITAGFGSWFFHTLGHHRESKWWLWLFLFLLFAWFSLPV